jgi:anti-sigma regulatory factor (Ser/Thr protein kinase)
MEAEAAFPADLRSAAEARRFVERMLRAWGCATLIETAQLLVSELVVNAVLHARTDARLRLVLDDERLHVEVRDRSTVLPDRRPYSPTATTGRGLMILDALSDAWGVQATDTGKTVWFDLSANLPTGAECAG